MAKTASARPTSNMVIDRPYVAPATGIVMLRTTLTLAAMAVSLALPTPAIARDQLVVLLDSSGSMAEPAPSPEFAGASRWAVATQGLGTWLQQIPKDIAVGATLVGGNCNRALPTIRPSENGRSELLNLVQRLNPSGMTPLNLALQQLPGVFEASSEGEKRVLIISDGMNTCDPMVNTCELVRQLNKDHGIRFDVLAFIAEPGMEAEFRCVAGSSGGEFRAPKSRQDWAASLPDLSFDPWPFIVLALGILSLLSGASIVYTYAFHILHWASGQSALAATVLFGVGVTALWLLLFASQGWIAGALGLVATGSLVMLMLRNNDKAPVRPNSGNSRPPFL